MATVRKNMRCRLLDSDDGICHSDGDFDMSAVLHILSSMLPHDDFVCWYWGKHESASYCVYLSIPNKGRNASIMNITGYYTSFSNYFKCRDGSHVRRIMSVYFKNTYGMDIRIVPDDGKEYLLHDTKAYRLTGNFTIMHDKNIMDVLNAGLVTDKELTQKLFKKKEQVRMGRKSEW